MNHIDRNRAIHEASQKYITMESNSLMNHLERIGLDPTSKQMVESMILALKDKNALATQLYEEIDNLKELAK